MGVQLLREVKACDSPALRLPGHRLVLWVLAEDARDETRLAFPGFDELMRLTGAPRRTVRRWLEDLTTAGLISRVPLGTSSTGRPVYAHPGKRATYKIHPLAHDAAAEPREAATHGRHKAATDGTHRDGMGATGGTNGGHGWHERRPPTATHPSSPVITPSPARARDAAGGPDLAAFAVATLRAALVEIGDDSAVRRLDRANDDHGRRLVRQLLGDRDVRDPRAYLRTAIDRATNLRDLAPTPTP